MSSMDADPRPQPTVRVNDLQVRCRCGGVLAIPALDTPSTCLVCGQRWWVHATLREVTPARPIPQADPSGQDHISG
jgi:hypothetical protein